MADQNLPSNLSSKSDVGNNVASPVSGTVQRGSPPPPPWVQQRVNQPVPDQKAPATPPVQSGSEPSLPSLDESQPPVPEAAPVSVPPPFSQTNPLPELSQQPPPASPPFGPEQASPTVPLPEVKIEEEAPLGVGPGAAPPASPPPPTFSTSSVAAAARGKGGDLITRLLPILGVVVALGVLVFVGLRVVLPRLRGGQGAETATPKPARIQANLTYWGLWEPDTVMEQVIADYEQSHPGVTITYTQQSSKDYRERLQSALAAGTGPDIFRYHNTWVPMLKSELDTAPKGVVNLDEYFPIVAKDIQVGTEIVGIPLMFDSLALYYNPRLFTEAGKTVPTTWEEVREIAVDMTVYNTQGKIQTAGIALGTTNNVDHFSDILGLMLLQNGANPARPSGQLAEDALRFYTLFSKTDRVWDQTLPASTYAFATEKVAMMLAPSWRAFQIKEINPDLQFRAAPAPQLPGTKIAWATYWVEGVSRRSKNTQAAWEFLQYLSSDEVLTKLYTAQATTRMFGEPYPKKTLAATIESDPVAGAFVKQGDLAQSWYLSSRTFDNGINDRIIKYYEDAVNAVLGGGSPQDALTPVAAGVAQVLSQYGVGSP